MENKLSVGKNLSVFNSEVIPVYTTDTGEKVVIGRELHEKLKIKTEYKDWFPRMCEYGFSDGDDYSSFLSDRSDGLPGKPKTNHIMSLDMAKHIAMIQRTPEGMEIRQKLIDLEKEKQRPMTEAEILAGQAQLLVRMERAQAEQAEQITAVNRRIDDIGEVISLNPNSWRTDARAIIVKIAHKLGGNEYIKDVQSEIFKLVDERGGKRLSIRLDHKRERMADEGVCKSKRDRLTKVDVIAEEKGLIEIYLAIVKEMAVKYGIGV